MPTSTLAAATVAFTTPAHPDHPTGWPITWGDPGKGIEVRPVAVSADGEVTDGQVAGYLAKYATKSTEATGHLSRRLSAETIDLYADPAGSHTERLIDACWRLGRPTHTPTPLATRPRPGRSADRLRDPWACAACGQRTRLAACPRCAPSRQVDPDTSPATTDRDNPWTGLRRWAHMFGFGGHFLTKSRRYSVTLRILRDNRVIYRRAQEPPPGTDAPDPDTTLVVNFLAFAGAGWHTTGDALLANTSAALARLRRRVGREEITAA